MNEFSFIMNKRIIEEIFAFDSAVFCIKNQSNGFSGEPQGWMHERND